jgi:hypothetical protein
VASTDDLTVAQRIEFDRLVGLEHSDWPDELNHWMQFMQYVPLLGVDVTERIAAWVQARWPTRKFIVTIKLPRNRSHDPQNKKSGACIVSSWCTDVTGEHHSYVLEAVNENDALDEARQAGHAHITRVEAIPKA